MDKGACYNKLQQAYELARALPMHLMMLSWSRKDKAVTAMDHLEPRDVFKRLHTNDPQEIAAHMQLPMGGVRCGSAVHAAGCCVLVSTHDWCCCRASARGN